MITLLFTTLTLLGTPFSYKTTDSPDVYDMVEQDSYEAILNTQGNTLYYSDLGVFTPRRYEYIEFHHNLGSGDLSFKFVPNTGTYSDSGTTVTWYQFEFLPLNESINSNAYLFDVRIIFPSTGSQIAKTVLLPNIFFNGYASYSDSSNADEFNFEAANFGINREFYITYSLGILPSSFVDTSATYQDGYNDGWNQAYDYAYEDGYSDGYNNGYLDAEDFIDASSATASVIFTGIIDVALLPINFFLACLNFEVFGINIGGFVTATLTVMIIIIIFRTIFNGGNSSKSD